MIVWELVVKLDLKRRDLVRPRSHLMMDRILEPKMLHTLSGPPSRGSRLLQSLHQSRLRPRLQRLRGCRQHLDAVKRVRERVAESQTRGRRRGGRMRRGSFVRLGRYAAFFEKCARCLYMLVLFLCLLVTRPLCCHERILPVRDPTFGLHRHLLRLRLLMRWRQTRTLATRPTTTTMKTSARHPRIRSHPRTLSPSHTRRIVRAAEAFVTPSCCWTLAPLHTSWPDAFECGLKIRQFDTIRSKKANAKSKQGVKKKRLLATKIIIRTSLHILDISIKQVLIWLISTISTKYSFPQELPSDNAK
ncbi:hypothetical protein BC830DRAFT_941051 [Chytriomyces sp. MP71]|nr:hypothetical protein BC830DRAFT_941051 [Chytriomyces sp. MP71]